MRSGLVALSRALARALQSSIGMLRPLRHEVLGCALGLGLALFSAPSPAAAEPSLEEGPPPLPTSVPPARTVRMHFRGIARIERSDITGGGSLVCVSPCTADLAAGTQLRAVRKGGERFAYTFGVPNDPGGEEDVEVSGASPLPLILGVSLGIVGTSSVVLGMVAEHFQPNADRGYVWIVGGVVTAAVGIVLLATRSKEPRVTIDLTHVAHFGSGLSF